MEADQMRFNVNTEIDRLKCSEYNQTLELEHAKTLACQLLVIVNFDSLRPNCA